MSTTNHSHFMSLALHLAERGFFTVSPNPMVGCVIVKKNHIIGQGFHEQAGCPHAEINALNEAGSNARGATVYITLEPCCHQGRTPPCTDALIKAGIKKIYVACLDPNPAVSGKGVSILRKAGIQVDVGICASEAQAQNEIFFYYMTHKRPFVIAKWAMSLDGKTITQEQDSRQISCQESMHHTHQIRRRVDAVLIGANTARKDNPRLTARYNDEIVSRQPVRIILLSKGFLPLDLAIFEPNSTIKTIVATTDAVDVEWAKAIAAKHIEVIVLPKNKNNQVDLPSLLDFLGKKEMTSILVEGGATIHHSFFTENLVNKIQFYLCPVIIGSLAKKQAVLNLDVSRLGKDFYFSADYQESSHV